MQRHPKDFFVQAGYTAGIISKSKRRFRFEIFTSISFVRHSARISFRVMDGGLSSARAPVTKNTIVLDLTFNRRSAVLWAIPHMRAPIAGEEAPLIEQVSECFGTQNVV